MNYAARMRRGQRVGHLNSNPQGAVQLQWPAVAKLPHVLAFNVLHGDEVQTVGFIHIEDCADVWVVQSGGQLRLALESFQVGFFDGEFSRQNFKDDRASELLIDSFVNGPLSAGAKLLSDFVSAEELPDHGERILVCKGQRGKSEERSEVLRFNPKG